MSELCFLRLHIIIAAFGRVLTSGTSRGQISRLPDAGAKCPLHLANVQVLFDRRDGLHGIMDPTNTIGHCLTTSGTKRNGHLRLDSRFDARQNGRMLQYLLCQFPSTRIHQSRGKNGVSPRATGWAKPCWKFGINTWRGFQLRLMLSF